MVSTEVAWQIRRRRDEGDPRGDRRVRRDRPGGARREQPPVVVLGPGDDAAVVRAADGRTVVSTDMLVEGRHFRLDWSTPRDIGRKAIAQNAADIEAMGATPTAFVVALGAPGDTSSDDVIALSDGMWEEARRIRRRDRRRRSRRGPAVGDLGHGAGRSRWPRPDPPGRARPGDSWRWSATSGGRRRDIALLRNGVRRARRASSAAPDARRALRTGPRRRGRGARPR